MMGEWESAGLCTGERKTRLNLHFKFQIFPKNDKKVKDSRDKTQVMCTFLAYCADLVGKRTISSFGFLKHIVAHTGYFLLYV